MNTEKLNEESQNRDERKRFQILNWISIIILWIGIVYCGFIGLYGDAKVIAAIILLTLSTCLTYFNYELGVKITWGIILLGVLNLLNFFPIKYVISFGTSSIEIGFEFILFGIGIIHYFTNREALTKFITDIFNREITEEEIISDQRRRINGFKGRFSKKKIEELEIIANNEELLPEAIKAAQELLEERMID